MKNFLSSFPKIISLLLLLIVLVTSEINRRENKSLKSEKKALIEAIMRGPDLSLSSAVIDSIGTDGTVYAMEIHAGEVGSSGDYSFPVVLSPTYKTKLWAKKSIYIPSEVWIVETTTILDTGWISQKQILGQSW